MERGKIISLFIDRRFGFIQKENGQKVHFRLQAVDRSTRWENLREGMEVTFEVEQGDRGPTAVRVRVVTGTPGGAQTGPAQSQPVGERPRGAYLFLNPYNFARYMDPPSRLESLDEPELRMWRGKPSAHDAPSGVSGKITCTLTAVTPLFVSSGKPAGGSNHPVLQFFKVNKEKVIPGSSLRGPVRAVFEAVTNSCFALMQDKPLSYRLEPGRALYLVPARVEQARGRWGLRLLTGTAALSTSAKPNPLYPAALRQYLAMRPSSKGAPGKTPPSPVSLAPLGSCAHPGEHHGKECWAVLAQGKFPPAWRVLAVAPDRAGAAAALARLRPAPPPGVVTRISQGYLCVTNQNIDNKASERFFFDDGAGGPKVIALPEDAQRKYTDLITDYQERHAGEVAERHRKGHDPKLPVPGSKDEPGFSRFVLKRSERYLQHGELVYAMLRGAWPNVQVEFIAPVSIPRVAYERGPADMLPAHLKRCETYEALCPACRTFGWVKGKQGGKERSAYRGRVRFMDAKQVKCAPLSPMTLAILGSPKPTMARFYLVGPDGTPKQGRSDQEAGYDGGGGKNRLRGRKVYRNFTPGPRSTQKDKTGQNCTIQDPEGPGAQFTFDVRFEDLHPEELGALLWSLTLGGEAVHKIGMGKPLGLGSVEITVDSLRIHDLQARYTTPDLLEAGQPEKAAGYIQCFQEAICRLYRPAEASRSGADFTALFRQLAPVVDLLALLGKEKPPLPVHYPYSPDPDSKGSFEWFVGNKRGDGPRLELGLAADDKGLPLLNKRGERR